MDSRCRGVRGVGIPALPVGEPSAWRTRSRGLPDSSEFNRVKVSTRRWKRHRMPENASRVSPKEAHAMQAFRPLKGCTTEIARRFHR
jgi:hypothetical protein